MKRGAAYIRVSTDDQLEYSPKSQLTHIQNYAVSHQITLLPEHIYTDKGISGRTDRRPAFQQMLHDAGQKPRRFDVLLLWEFSRFARNREDSILYKSLLRKKYGIDVISVKEPLSTDPTSILVEALLEAMDEYYSLNLGQEVRRGMNEKFLQGGVVTIAPFGYRIENGNMIPDPVTARWIPYLFEQYLRGKTFTELAHSLNCSGLRTVRGKNFEGRSIRYILSNPVYLGKCRRRREQSHKNRYYDGEDMIIVDGKHVSLISKDVFNKVQVQLSKYPVKRIRTKSKPYPLYHLVYCAECGCLLSKTKNTLQCSGYARGNCTSHAVSQSRLTEAVIHQIKQDLPNMSILIGRKCRNTNDSSMECLNKQLSRIRMAYEKGVETLEDYRKEKQRIEMELATLSQQPVHEIPQFKINLYTLLDLCCQDDTLGALSNRVLYTLIERITISRPNHEVQIIYRN